MTGTDTGIGKTIVTAALALCLQHRGVKVGVMKPVETGIGADLAIPSDAERLKAGIDCADPLDLISPYRLPAPLAPLAAARQAGVVIDVERIMAAFLALTARHEFLLVEGVGGVMAPIADRFDVRDLISRLGLPALIVGRATLGGVNHALLTVEALRQRDIAIAGIVLNRSAARPAPLQEQQQQEATVSLLKELSGVLVLGPLPHQGGLLEDWEGGLARLAIEPVIQELARLVKPSAP
ncbi:MAG: dethiobiotin synthase [Nitrospirae bacterium]|nr:dethiobiotin synthase [Nitrospirota bacterium]